MILEFVSKQGELSVKKLEEYKCMQAVQSATILVFAYESGLDPYLSELTLIPTLSE